MTQYIDKNDLIVEIERLHKEHTSKEYRDEATLVLEDLEDFINTLEVKEEFKIGETKIYLDDDGGEPLIMVSSGLTSVVRNMKFHQTSSKMEIMWKLLFVKHRKKNDMTEIKKGNCYMCLKDIKGYDSFTKGKVYQSLYDNALINDNHIEVLVRPSDYFRIVTEQEIKAQKGNNIKGE